jgi:hypothetical protein
LMARVAPARSDRSAPPHPAAATMTESYTVRCGRGRPAPRRSRLRGGRRPGAARSRARTARRSREPADRAPRDVPPGRPPARNRPGSRVARSIACRDARGHRLERRPEIEREREPLHGHSVGRPSTAFGRQRGGGISPAGAPAAVSPVDALRLDGPRAPPAGAMPGRSGPRLSR